VHLIDDGRQSRHGRDRAAAAAQGEGPYAVTIGVEQCGIGHGSPQQLASEGVGAGMEAAERHGRQQLLDGIRRDQALIVDDLQLFFEGLVPGALDDKINRNLAGLLNVSLGDTFQLHQPRQVGGVHCIPVERCEAIPEKAIQGVDGIEVTDTLGDFQIKIIRSQFCGIEDGQSHVEPLVSDHRIQRGLQNSLAGASGQPLKALGWNFLDETVDESDLADGLEGRCGGICGSERVGFLVVVGHVSETGDAIALVFVRFSLGVPQVDWEDTNVGPMDLR